MYQRPELQTIISRLQEPPHMIQVIMGARQVGKTTLIKQLLETHTEPYHYASADAVPAGDSSWLRAIWEAARLRYVQNKTQSYLLVLDEVQKISNWSEEVKRLWDEDRFYDFNIKVVLLGSSRMLLQSGLSESLAGRFETMYLTHWTYTEIEAAFGLGADQYAWYGSYPGSMAFLEDEQRWKRYILDSLIEPSISRDILMLTRIDKPALLKNLFELACHYSGQIVSLNKMLGQLVDAGNTTTLSHYLQLLHSAGLLSGLENYTPSRVRQRASSPKLQVHNNALFSVMQSTSFQDARANLPLWGRVIESAIGAHLVNQSIKSGFKLYYWKDRNAEVDFVLERGDQLVALEVKSNLTRQHNGLIAFRKQYPHARTLLIDNRVLTWQEVLGSDPLAWF